MVSLEDYAKDNPHKSRFSQMEDPKLEKLFDQIQLAKKNERLAKLAGATIEENKVMKNLIIELLKENQKLKTENKLFNKNN